MFFSCLEAVDWRSIERPALFLLPTRTIELSKRLQACGFILTVGNCANSELCETIESTWCLVYTPSVQHGNIEPEHLVLEKEILFSGSMLNFRGVSLLPDSPCFCWKRKRGDPRLRAFAGANCSYPSFGFSQFGMWGSWAGCIAHIWLSH